jgi:hypothetical protein
MKTTLSIYRFPRIAFLTLLGALAFPAISEAKPKSKAHHESWGYSHGDRSYYDGSRYDRVRRDYHAHPRSGFTISFGTGYAGRGYYYGPPGAAYYYERPDVRYYRTRAHVPGYNVGRGYHADDSGVAVQRALYRRGYYRGPIDGDIGPGTRRAIARFEAEHGMPVRGYVSGRLLEALGVR